MPAESPSKTKGKDANTWKAHFTSLVAALEATDGVHLLEAKADLQGLLTKVSKRVKSQGGGSLVEKMALAASCNTTQPLKVQDAQKLLEGMTAKLRVRVNRADPCRGLVSASCCGTWGLVDGQSFHFKASVKEVLGKVSGQIAIEGLGFKSDASLSSGKFDCDAKALVGKIGVKIAEADLIRAVVVGLELFARRKAVGLADIDVLAVTFGCLRTVCGLPATLEHLQDGSEASGSDEDGMEEEDDEAEADEEASEKSESMAEEDLELAESSEPEEGEEEKQSEEDKSEEEAKSEEEKSDDEAVAKASDDESSAGRVLPTKASDSEDEKSEAIPEVDNEDDDKKKAQSDSDEYEDTTVFVSKSAFKAVKTKLTQGKAPTQAELTKLADFDAVPDGEDVVCIDASVLGPAFTSPGDRKEAVKALVAEHNLKGAAELFIKAEEAAGLEMGDDEGEEEESEDGDEAEEDEAPVAKASPAKAPAGKAAAKAAAFTKVPPKAPAAKAPAAKRARTS